MGRLRVMTLMLLGACGQLDLQGAADACPDQQADATACAAPGTSAPVMESHAPQVDATAGGRLSGAPLSIGARPIPQVVAVDFSGSMYAGQPIGGKWAPPATPYLWETPGFRALLEGGPLAHVGPADPVHAMLFNRDVYLVGEDGIGAWEPTDHRFSSVPQAFSSSAAALPALTGKAVGGRLPDNPWKADFGQKGMAIESRLPQVLDAAEAFFGSQPDGDGVLWIVTDNFIDGGGGPDAVANLAFYTRIKDEPRWQVAYAWPVSRADWLGGSTLLVYGLYWSGRELVDAPTYAALAQADDARLGGKRLHETFSGVANPASPSAGQPFKLKPQHLDVVRMTFEGDVSCPPAAAGVARECAARISVENLLDHRRIDSGRIELQSRRIEGWGVQPGVPDGSSSVRVATVAPMCADAVTATVALDQPIGPREKRVVDVTLKVPAVAVETYTLRDHWESAAHEQFLMVGSLDASIQDLQSSLAVEPAMMADVYGTAELPDIFKNPSTDDLTTHVCVSMLVSNPSWLASITVLGLLGVVVAAIALGTWLARPVFRVVRIDGVDRGRIRISRISSAEIELDRRVVARARRSLGGAITVGGVRPWQVTKRGNAWVLRDPSNDTTRTLELGTGSGRAAAASARDDF
ncbi:MAG: hypothetical protein Q8P18_32590 [Pseudomonadota bacterium]|nr:hypothetical protein [Pseudomonadota bacterium]